MKPIRVLHILTALDRGGIETMLMNYYRNIDTRKVQFDFLLHRKGEFAYSYEVRERGGRIYSVPNYNPLSTEYTNALNSFFAEHKEYSIVHSHLNCLSAIPLKYAKINGVPVRIAHAHIIIKGISLKNVYKIMAKREIRKYATEYCACGVAAGNWMFPKEKIKVIHNAIDVEKFNTKNSFRNAYRKELGITDSFVLGTVGRFTEQKNHLFLLKLVDILKETNLKLVIIGEGPLGKKYDDYIRKKGIQENVLILNPRDDIPGLMNAMDVFVFPSKYEGLGIVAVEAQSSGLITICSDNVPKEVEITESVDFLSLKESVWISKIKKLMSEGYHYFEQNNDKVLSSQFNIKKAADELTLYYENLLRGSLNNET